LFVSDFWIDEIPREELRVPIFALMTDSFSNASLAFSSTPSAFTLGMFSPMVTNLLIGVFLIICVVMILTVLIQRPQGGGLSGAFGAGGSGGGGAGQTAFGTKTGDVLTWATITIFVLFLVFAIVLNFATRPQVAPASQPIITLPAGEAESVDIPTDSPLDTLGEDAQDAGEDLIDLSGTPAAGEPETVPETTPTEDE
jgi:preprotein translocase subunit SecG